MQLESATTSIWKVIGWAEKVYQPAPGMPYRAAGCCDNCGQGIRYVVTIRDQAGQTMDVGQDCAVTLVGGDELREMRRLQREYEGQLYLASVECAEAGGYRAGCEFLRRERRLEAETLYGLQLLGFRLIAKSPNVARQHREWAANVVEGILDGRGCPELTSNSADESESTGFLYELASLPPSRYMGHAGQKFAAEALFEACIPFDTDYGRSYVQKFRTRDGALLVWFSKAGGGKVGEWVRISGTVKGHEERSGEEQTVVTRCKVLDREGA
jgi:hypothetical protein